MGGMGGSIARPAKDPNWLTLEVCREYARNKCNRVESECKFAHPPPHIDVQNGRVTCCFDSLQGRCQRVDPPCKYFHPPDHLKDQLSHSRRAVPSIGLHYQPMAQQSSGMVSGTAAMPYINPYLLQTAVGAFSPYLAQALAGGQPSFGDVATSGECPPGVASTNPLTVVMPASATYSQVPRSHRSDRMEVCREYQRGVCTRSQSECRYAHPPNGMAVDADNHVTVCMDFVKGRCHRETCRYFHLPPHLQAQSLRPSSYPLSTMGATLVTAAGPTMVPRMTTISTSAYPSLLPLGTISTTAGAGNYQQQAALLAALQIQQQSLFNLSLSDRRPSSSDADRY